MAGVMAVTFLAFLPVLDNGFVFWDDHVVLLQNFNYRGFEWDRIAWMFTTRLMCHFQPLTWFTYAVDYALWGMAPWGYHLTSLLFHVATAGAFFWVARRLLHVAIGRDTSGAGIGLTVAAGLAALLFAVHPLRVESVAWATERRDVTSGLFFMLTLGAYLRASSLTGRAKRTWLAISLVAYVLSLMGKSIGMTLPVVLVVLDAYPLGRLGRFGRGWLAPAVRAVWWEKLPYLAIAIAAAVTAFLGQYHSAAIATIKGVPLVARLPIAFYGTTFYVYKTLVPLGLSPLYLLDPPRYPPVWHFWVCAAAIVLVTVGVVVGARRWPAGAASWIVYLVILAPVAGLIQIGPQIAADRYTYLSCVGWAVLVAGGWLTVWHRRTGGSAWKVALVVTSLMFLSAVGALVWLTQRQVRVWQDTETLWGQALCVQPENAIAHTSLANWLDEQGRLIEALSHHDRSAKLRPNEAGVHSDRGNTLLKLRRQTEAEAAFRKAIEKNPRCLGAHNGLGRILTASRTPSRVKEGIQHFREALRINAAYVPARINLSVHFMRRRRFARAQKILEEGLRVDPRSAPLSAKLAWLLATCPAPGIRNGQEALTLAHQANVATAYSHPVMLDVLAAALAETGQFDRAVQTARQAVRLARQGHHHELAAAIETRASAYGAGRAWREPR